MWKVMLPKTVVDKSSVVVDKTTKIMEVFSLYRFPVYNMKITQPDFRDTNQYCIYGICLYICSMYTAVQNISQR